MSQGSCPSELERWKSTMRGTPGWVTTGPSPEGIGWGAGILRFVFFVLGAVPLYAGWWIAFFSEDRLAWHDRMAGTRVVRTS